MDQSCHVASGHSINNARRFKATIDQGTHRLSVFHPNISTISNVLLQE
jgi:hypothetical protein